MNPITLNDSLAPDYGIAVEAQYKFYVAFTWWDDAQKRHRFAGCIIPSASPTLDAKSAWEAIERLEKRGPVVILFWKEQ